LGLVAVAVMSRVLGILAMSIGLTGLPRVADAHAIHSTLTVVSVDDRTVSLSIRAFADDFSASVARFAGQPTPRDSSASTENVTRYVRARVWVVDSTGGALTLEPCGVRRERDLYWLCFRTLLARSHQPARINNQMLTELHSDQVNVVQLTSARERKSFLFTRGSPAVVLAP
jgi:hypothetical protein